MIDLNSDNFKERENSPIFNGGNAGRVEGVTLELEKKDPLGPPGAPAYKLFAIDTNGGKINGPFWIKNDMELSRVLHVARAVLGSDYKFDSYPDYETATHELAKLINKNLDGKTFNVYATYGTTSYPSQYLGLRYFDFVEPGDVDATSTRLYKKKSDMLDRLVPDTTEKEESNDSSDDGWV